MLNEIDLGENGRQVYSMQASVAQREKATWQAYAASVWFRVQDKWIHAIVGENSLPGALKQSLDSSRRNTEDKDNLLQFFCMGLMARYPDLDDNLI